MNSGPPLTLLARVLRYLGGEKCCAIAGPEMSRDRVCFSIFLSVKLMWSGIHGGNTVLADKTLLPF